MDCRPLIQWILICFESRLQWESDESCESSLSPSSSLTSLKIPAPTQAPSQLSCFVVGSEYSFSPTLGSEVGPQAKPSFCIYFQLLGFCPGFRIWFVFLFPSCPLRKGIFPLISENQKFSCFVAVRLFMNFPGGTSVKNLSATQGMRVQPLGCWSSVS